MVEHSSVVHMIVHQQSACAYNNKDVFIQNFSISFDASMLDIFVPLAVGASIVPAAKRAKEDVSSFLRQMAEFGVTVATGVPSELRLWLTCGPKALEGLRVRWILIGGEALPPSLLHSIVQPIAGCRIYYMYGPTEVSSCSVLIQDSPCLR